MIYQVIIEVPSNLAVLDVDGAGDFIIGNDVVGELAAMQAQWVNRACPDGGHMMPGTRIYNNRKVIHALITVPYADPLTLLEGVLDGYGLDWVIWTMESLREQLVVDENDEPVLVDDGEGNMIKQYEIQVEKELTSDFAKFLADVMDPITELPVRPTLPKQLHQYVPWRTMMVMPI